MCGSSHFTLYTLDFTTRRKLVSDDQLLFFGCYPATMSCKKAVWPPKTRAESTPNKDQGIILLRRLLKWKPEVKSYCYTVICQIRGMQNTNMYTRKFKIVLKTTKVFPSNALPHTILYQSG